MFTLTLDILFFFIVITPLTGLLGHKIGFHRFPAISATVGFITSLASFPSLYNQVIANGGIITITLEPFMFSIGSCLEIDMLSLFMATIFLFIGLVTCLYSIRFMEQDTGLVEYFTLLLVAVAGMVGISFAGDLFTFFIFWEIMCISSYALVAFRKGKWEPVEAGFKYLIMGSAGSITVLYAMSFLYGMTGTLNFANLAESLNAMSNIWLYLALTLIIVGFGVVAAIAPFHTWLPDAYTAAPSPISALLSGIVSKAGAYALIRCLLLLFLPERFAWQSVLVIFAIFTMFVGNFMALLQKDIKRLLAFSSVVNMGYIIFALSIATEHGLTGGLFHIMNHAVMTALLFLCAGSLIYRTRERNLDNLAGIGRSMPITTGLLVIGALATAGFPGLNGFMSELMIIIAGIESGLYIPTALMLLNILFSIAYYLLLIHKLIIKKPTTNFEGIKESPKSMLAIMVILATLCVVIGVYPAPFISFANAAAKAALNVQAYIEAMIG
ncbi:NADH-quinone oxidoreductase subunit M [Candidatus Bathyarchaeota archaeon]|nr:NADH-quinone oxidoreductase subunit M [Candidatus Bathyarchaeota archaeon]